MTFVVRLRIFVLLFILFILFLPKIANSYELLSIGDEHVPFIIDICKLYRTKSVIFLYGQSIKEMEMTTMIFKWTRALSREGYMTSNLYFSELHESSYYVKRIVRPHYIALISNYEAINEFSLATNTFDMSFSAWLVLFIYKGHGFDYCHNPPGNIFHLRFDSEMLVRCGMENILREWYSINSNRTEIDDVATWSLDKRITKLVPDSLYERRCNLQGLIMRAVVVKDSSFINVKEDGQLDGTFGKILTELSVALNFSFDIVSKVAENGRLNTKDNTWSGAIGELYAGHADISITDFSMTSARLNAIDFTLPLVISKKCLYIKEPQLFAIKWSSYLLAFSNSIWIAISGVLIVVPILLIFLKTKNESSRNVGHALFDNFLDIWGIFCQQGLPDFPHRSSLRIAYFSIFLLGVVLSAAYSAALISFLTSVIQTLPFHSLENFVEDGTYQFLVFSGSADYDTFTNGKDPLAKKLKKLMPEEKKLPITMVEGFEIICKNPKLALYTSEARKESINHKIPCNVVPVDAERLESLAIILSKQNPFTAVINFHLQKFINNGMMDRLKDRTFKRKYNFILNLQPVCINSIISLILLIQLGIILSVCILIVEKCIFSRKSTKMSIEDRILLKKSSKFYVHRKKSIKNIAKHHANREFARIRY